MKTWIYPKSSRKLQSIEYDGTQESKQRLKDFSNAIEDGIIKVNIKLQFYTNCIIVMSRGTSNQTMTQLFPGHSIFFDNENNIYYMSEAQIKIMGFVEED